MNITCRNCGNEVPPGKKFCTSCGAEIPEPSVPMPAQPSPEPATPPAAGHSYDPPAFEIRTPRAPDNTPATLHAPAPDPDRHGPFDKRPWLIHAIAAGALAIIVIPFIVAFIVALSRKSGGPAEETGRNVTTPVRAPAPAKKDCLITLSKSLGAIRTQPGPGTNLFAIKTGDCLEYGASLFTSKDARALISLSAENIALHLNSLSGVTIGAAADPAKEASISFLSGETWVDAPAARKMNMTLLNSAAEAACPCKFHILFTNDNHIFITVVAGKVQYEAGNTPIDILPGRQLEAVPSTGATRIKDIDLESFQRWVYAWKDDFRPPKKYDTTKITQAEKQDERKLILETAAKEFPDKLPQYVNLTIFANTADWAIVEYVDGRPEDQQGKDKWRRQIGIIQKISGHWMLRDTQYDYNESVFKSWKDRFNFDKKAETDLKLSY